jgi:hypothetical protein
MSLGFRHFMIWVYAGLWIVGTCRFELGVRSVQELTDGRFWDRLRADYSDAQVLMWWAMMMAVMLVGDRLLCRYANWRHGVDPLKVHWSRLRNREGDFLCGACLSPFMVAPEDGRAEAFVHCGDCGHAVARYGEMRLHSPERIRAYQGYFARRLGGWLR